MTPPLRTRSESTVDVVREVRTSRVVRWYAISLLGAALVAVVVLVVAGAAFPEPGPFLLLAIPVALCMNRFVFFPNETGATAEAAVLFAAAVAFRDDAVFLGPLVLALLVGLLDAGHWEHRSFLRMAYNSGSQGITMLASLAMFVPLAGAGGSSWLGLSAAVAVAAVPYVLTETALGVVLVCLQGERVDVAIRHQLPVNALSLPLALFGAVAGFVASELGWWAAFAMLIPTPLVPEFVLVQARRRWPHGAATGMACAVCVVIGLVVLAVTEPPSDPLTLGLLLAFAVLLGVELRAGMGPVVPPAVGLVVAAALVLAPGRAVLFEVPLVAIAATLSAWCAAGRSEHCSRPAAFAGAIGFAVAGLYVASDLGTSTLDVVLDAVLAAAVFELGVVASSERRRAELARVLWTAPLLMSTVALALAWREIGHLGALLFATGMYATLVGVSRAGAPPWRSRVLGPRGLNRRAEFLTLCIAALSAVSALAVLAVDGTTHDVLLLVAVATGESAVATALASVRQWRFAPRGRRRQAIRLGAVAVLLATAYPALGFAGNPGGIVVLLASLSVASRVIWTLRPAAATRSARDQRRPESRRASR